MAFGRNGLASRIVPSQIPFSKDPVAHIFAIKDLHCRKVEFDRRRGAADNFNDMIVGRGGGNEKRFHIKLEVVEFRKQAWRILCEVTRAEPKGSGVGSGLLCRKGESFANILYRAIHIYPCDYSTVPSSVPL